jgi:multicomponent Na+:H+ antiporter subunit E
MKKDLWLIILLVLIWVICSGKFTVFYISCGIVAIIHTLRIARCEDFEYEKNSGIKPLMMLVYIPWLFKEIVFATYDVIKLIINGKISPIIKSLKTKQHTNVGETIYADSISLTPGTFTIDAGDEILVHALAKEAIAELQTGYMDEMVSKTQKESDE